MRIKNTASGFGLVTILLHWLTAIIAVFLFSLGLYMTGLDYYDPLYHKAPWVHKSIGLIGLGIVLFRLVWRTVNPLPQSLSKSDAERILASVAHFLLYAVLLLIFVSGYLISSADGSAVSLFDWVDFPAVRLGIDNQEDKAGVAHFYLAWGLIAIAALHMLAALKHHFIDKDRTLVRMLSPKKHD
ncbi:cytochrome b [Aurantivibrio plasticivorans]